MLPDFRTRQRDYLLEITRSITQELDLERVLARILAISVEMLAGQAGLIALRQETGGWGVSATHGIPPALEHYLDPLLAAVSDRADANGADAAGFELPEINRILQTLARQVSLGLLTGVGLPLIARSKVVGVIFIFRSYAGLFSAADRSVLESFAAQAAIAVDNARLYTQVSRDKRRVDALLDSAADGVLILLPDHTIERVNPALERMLGISAPNLRGRKHEDVIRWTKRATGLTLEQAEAGGWPLTPNATLYVEGDLERPTAPPLPIGITYAPLVEERTLINVIATVRDITRFREAEELKRTFISVISHELKTPVALIKGYVSTLRRDDVAWDQAILQDSLQVIEEEADRLTDMIENLLDASRLEAGGLKIHLADFSLPALAERAAARLRTQTNRHTLVVDFPPGFPVLMGDEDRLYQVLSNLISNAIKYAPDGGEIRISGQVRPNQVIVCVSDQGPGIAPEDLPHVFDRFYRASEASKNTKGAGLGLYLARAIIQAHGGRIWVDPKPGEGARICFSLPREES